MAELGTGETLLAEASKALVPLGDAVSSPERFFAFMLKLGWHAEDVPQPLRDTGAGIERLYSALRDVLGDDFAVSGSVALDSGGASASVSADDLLRLADAFQQVVSGIRALATAPDSAFPAALVADGFKATFPRQVVDYLIVNYLVTYQPWVAFALRALGVVKATYTAPTGTRVPYIHYELALPDLPAVITDPRRLLENAFGWGRADFDAGALIAQVDNFLNAVGVDTFIEVMPTAAAKKVEGGVEVEGEPVRRMLSGVIFERSRPGGRMAADVRLMPLPANGAKLPGLALMPAFNGLLDIRLQLGDDVAVTIRSDLDLQGGVALEVRPGLPIEMILGFETPGSPVSATGSIDVRVERSGLDEQPALLFGRPDGTRLEYAKLGGAAGVRLDAGSAVDVFAELELKGLQFVLRPSEGDGFIARIFPADGIRFGSDLTLGASYRNGFYFRGASHLEISVPAHVRLGPLDVRGLTIAAKPSGGALPIGLGASVAADLGPLKAVVENIGLTASLSFPSTGGNLGVANLALEFKAPDGVGLSIDAGVVKGGGYLFFNKDRQEYGGALELEFAGTLTLKAIGIITTRMPDGSSGFSLLIIITAEFGTGIQLGFGFTLLGVGGLLGLNRTVSLPALMEGVRTGSINSIMFPRDVVANAPRIISDLRTVFPPLANRFLIGPMAKLGWGTPTLVSVSIGVVIEIPGNVAIVGVLRVAVPADDAPLIVLQVNFAGAIEFDRKRLYFFASLFESRIVFLTIDGEMGLLAAYGDDANFVLSVGGFHPRFEPPALPFPSPRRISVSLLNTPVSRMRVEGYFAVTTNTVQFGAAVEVFFGLDAINVKGNLAFDALFQISPLHFVIEISASLSVNVFGAGLFSVHISGMLEGPSPWHVKGHGSISLLFWDVGVDFEVTWGETADTQLPPISVMPLVRAAVEQDQSWRAVLPSSSRSLVSLRELPADEKALVLHPLGVLRVSERAIPLGLRLDKVGNQKPSDVNKVVAAVSSGGLETRADAFEQFAPAQFQEFSDAEKLSRPAFARERSGLDLSAKGGDTRSSVMVKRVVRYEEIIIDSNFKRFQRPFFSFVGVLFLHFLAGAAIAHSELSQAVKVQMQPFEDRIEVAPETFAVVFEANNQAVAPEAAAFHSEASAREFMQTQLLTDAALQLQVVPSFELAA